ncbi:MAG: tRNA uridine-5-carboxymethylaminomethyl(34) synthesis GTPase MnmE [Alistipes sp.]|nr:tRNA uridine-5-carboxymethylaminomethyl(34) synthesis GTPase MnmE [Candidatus Alistipes equi]
MEMSDIIVAPATPSQGALAIIRVSGCGSIALVGSIFEGKRRLSDVSSHTLHHGIIKFDNEIIDEVVISIFRAPNSFTGEDSVEISCHGSLVIMNRIIEVILLRGARMADHGEFSKRAFLAGKIDLSQAEAIADMISSSSKLSHRMALTQMRGGYSKEISNLREQLLSVMSMLELELDFSEEDVEFVNRQELMQKLSAVYDRTSHLRDSFRVGNVIKRGVVVTIAGSPNVGKSTLLNAILEDDRALVSSVAGTTRDTVEETKNIDGILFRFIDTAGLHESGDEVEALGMKRSLDTLVKSDIILHVVTKQNIDEELPYKLKPHQKKILVINKCDIFGFDSTKGIAVSAKGGLGIDKLISTIRSQIDDTSIMAGESVVSSMRHFNAFKDACLAIQSAIDGISNKEQTVLLAEHLRQSILSLGEITGEITNEDILQNIFSHFCIGK